MSVGDKLLSRKFWLALSAVVALFIVAAYGEVAQIVIAYLAVQAGVDAFSSYTQARATSAADDETPPAAPLGD